MHINSLELTAGAFAVKSFTKGKFNIHVLLRMDNTTALTYIQKLGGTRSLILAKLTKDLWEYCLSKQITLATQHLPGRNNLIADWESRHVQDSSDWLLKRSLFQALQQKWGPWTVDLFASRWNRQLKSFYSWKPDPLEIDAFQVTWTGISGYAFPPIFLVTQQNSERECIPHINNPGMARTTVVPPAPQYEH